MLCTQTTFSRTFYDVSRQYRCSSISLIVVERIICFETVKAAPPQMPQESPPAGPKEGPSFWLNQEWKLRTYVTKNLKNLAISSPQRCWSEGPNEGLIRSVRTVKKKKYFAMLHDHRDLVFASIGEKACISHLHDVALFVNYTWNIPASYFLHPKSNTTPSLWKAGIISLFCALQNRNEKRKRTSQGNSRRILRKPY